MASSNNSVKSKERQLTSTRGPNRLSLAGGQAGIAKAIADDRWYAVIFLRWIVKRHVVVHLYNKGSVVIVNSYFVHLGDYIAGLHVAHIVVDVCVGAS